MTDHHDEYMGLAIAEADLATEHDDTPVGAIIVHDGQVIASRHNERELTGDPTAHAAILAIRDAADRLGSWRLHDCTLYVTFEPCAMCSGAALGALVDAVVYGTPNPDAGTCGTLYNLGTDPRMNHEFKVTGGVRAHECGTLLNCFFSSRS